MPLRKETIVTDKLKITDAANPNNKQLQCWSIISYRGQGGFFFSYVVPLFL